MVSLFRARIVSESEWFGKWTKYMGGEAVVKCVAAAAPMWQSVTCVRRKRWRRFSPDLPEAVYNSAELSQRLQFRLKDPG
jgi:hypothetical protein